MDLGADGRYVDVMSGVRLRRGIAAGLSFCVPLAWSPRLSCLAIPRRLCFYPVAHCHRHKTMRLRLASTANPSPSPSHDRDAPESVRPSVLSSTASRQQVIGGRAANRKLIGVVCLAVPIASMATPIQRLGLPSIGQLGWVGACRGLARSLARPHQSSSSSSTEKRTNGLICV